MKVTALRDVAFKPIELCINIETKDELDGWLELFKANMRAPDAVFGEGTKIARAVGAMMGNVYTELNKASYKR